MNWRPIKTAPTDGTRILCYGKAYCPRGWSNWTEESDEDHPIAYGWSVQLAYKLHDLWQIGGFSGFLPTHWMPLPEAPQ